MKHKRISANIIAVYSMAVYSMAMHTTCMTDAWAQPGAGHVSAEKRAAASKFYQRGLAALTNKDFKGSLVLLNKTIEEDNSNASYYAFRSSLLCALQKFEPALADSNMAIVLDPKLPQGYFARAQYYVHINNTHAAIADLKQAIKLNFPAPEMAKKQLAKVEEDEALLKLDAGSYYGNHKAMKLRSDGVAKMHGQDYEGAAKDFAGLIALFPKEESGYTLLGTALAKQDLMSQAIGQYDKAIAINDHSKAFLQRGQAYLAARNMPKAIADFETCRKLNIDLPQATSFEGECLVINKDYLHALDIFNKLVLLQPDKTNSFLSRGQCYLKLGRNKEAVDDFSTVIKLRPSTTYAYLGRAKAYELLGKKDLAAKDIAMSKNMSTQLDSELFPRK